MPGVSRRTRIRQFFPLAFIFAVALGFGIGAAFAASSAPLPNTVLARFVTDLDTRVAHPGQQVNLEIVPPFPNGDATYEGASVHGHVAGVLPPARGRAARVALAFDEIRLPNGAVAPIAAHAHAHAGGAPTVGKILGHWAGFTSGADFIVQRGSTVRVHVDQTMAHARNS